MTHELTRRPGLHQTLTLEGIAEKREKQNVEMIFGIRVSGGDNQVDGMFLETVLLSTIDEW